MKAQRKRTRRVSGKPTNIRLMPEMNDAIGRAHERIRAERPGQRVERADVIRILIAEALIARGIPTESPTASV